MDTNESILWPAWSPDPTSLNLFIWGYPKKKISCKAVANRPRIQLFQRIEHLTERVFWNFILYLGLLWRRYLRNCQYQNSNIFFQNLEKLTEIKNRHIFLLSNVKMNSVFTFFFNWKRYDLISMSKKCSFYSKFP